MEYGLKPLGRERFWLLLLLAPTLIGLIFGAFGSILATIILSFFWGFWFHPGDNYFKFHEMGSINSTYLGRY